MGCARGGETAGVPPAWRHGDQVARLFKEYLGLRLRFLPGNGRLPGIGVLMLGIVQCGRDARGPGVPAWHRSDQVARLFKEYLGLRLRFLLGNGRLPGIGVLMLGIVQCGRDARGPRGQDFQLALRCRSSD